MNSDEDGSEHLNDITPKEFHKKLLKIEIPWESYIHTCVIHMASHIALCTLAFISSKQRVDPDPCIKDYTTEGKRNGGKKGLEEENLEMINDNSSIN